MIEMMKVRRKPNPKCKNEEMIIMVDKDLFLALQGAFYAMVQVSSGMAVVLVEYY